MAVVAPVTENRVEQRPVARNPIQAQDFGGQRIPEAVEGLGKRGVQFAEQQAEMDIRFAQTAAQKARTEALRRAAEVRSRVTQAQGLDAERERQAGVEEIETIKREGMAALKDPTAQRMFSDSFESAVQSDVLRMREHADGQLRIAENNEADSAIDLATERAVDLRDNPEAVAAERDTIIANVARRLKGAAPQTIELAKRKVLSNLHTRTAVAILQTDDPGTGMDAMEYYRKHATEITPEDEARLFQIIQPQYDNDIIEGVFGETAAAVAGAAAVPPPEGEQPAPTPRTVKGSDYSPTGEIGRVSTTPAQHARRGRVATDYAAPIGTPIRPPVSGEVLEAPRELQGANGYMVRIKHPNGYVTTYLHMRAPSPLKPGDQVTAGTIIGSVGSTGRSTGPHVDFSVRDASGKVVNPDSVTWTGEALPVHTAQRHDLEGWYRQAHKIATERGLNSRQYEQLLQRVDRHVGRQETLERRQQDDIDRAVASRMAELDEELTDIGQIPNYGEASPALQMQIKNMIDQNTRAREPEANSDIYYEVDGLAYGSEADQREFLQVNPKALPITRAEQRALQRRQQQIRGEIRESLSDSETAASLSQVESSMRRMLGSTENTGFQGKIDTPGERQRWATLRTNVARREQVERKRLGRPLTDIERDNLVRTELMPVTVRSQGWFGERAEEVPAYRRGEKKAALGEDYRRTTISVPEADRARIVQELRRRGVTPTEGQIVAWYRRSLIYQ